MKNKILMPKKKSLYLLMLPGMLLHCLIYLVPIVLAVYFSAVKWKGSIPVKFIGIQNYIKVCKDENFWLALKNNLFIIVLCIIFQIGIGFLFSVFVRSKYVKCRNVHRFAIFTPVVLAPIVVGLVWSVIYRMDGLLDTVLRSLGLGSAVSLWLDDPKIVMVFATIPIIWQSIGYYAVIFMAGLSSISEECYESAQLDGANGFQRMLYITLPLMKTIISTCIILSIAGNMKIFDHLFVLTKGGPGRASTVLAMYAYDIMFKQNNIGYGSAVSIAILIFGLVFVCIFKLLFRGGDSDE